MAIYKNTPPIVRDNLIYYIDAANIKCTPKSGSAEISRTYSSVSNGTLTATSSILPDGTSGSCFKIQADAFTGTFVIENGGHDVLGTSTFYVFVKPVEYFYVKLRDGDTTNDQVDFDLINGTIIGGNAAVNGRIVPYPNGWFLLSLTINRASGFGYGTRLVVSDNPSFTAYNGTLGYGVLRYNPTMISVAPNVIDTLSGRVDVDRLQKTARLINGTTINKEVNGAFAFDGSDDLIESDNYDLDLRNGYTAIMVAKWNNFNGGSFEVINQNPKFLNFYNGGNSVLRLETYAGNAMNAVTPITLGKYTFVAGTFSGVSSNGASGTARIYMNGRLDNTATLAGYTDIRSRFRLGAYAGYFNGSIAYFMFYNKRLTDSEIQQNYNALKTRFGL